MVRVSTYVPLGGDGSDIRQLVWWRWCIFCYSNKPGVMELLVKGCTSGMNLVNKAGRTSLHVAVCKQHVDCVRVLLKFHCDVNVQVPIILLSLHRVSNKVSWCEALSPVADSIWMQAVCPAAHYWMHFKWRDTRIPPICHLANCTESENWTDWRTDCFMSRRNNAGARYFYLYQQLLSYYCHLEPTVLYVVVFTSWLINWVKFLRCCRHK